MRIGDNIKYLREKSNMSQVDLANLLGITDKAVSTWENGTRIPRIGMIEKISSIFNVPKSQILDAELQDKKPLASNLAPLPKMKKIPLVGSIACGKPILAEEHITEYIDLPTHIRADYALTCRGDSMINAGINDGDIVYIRKQETVENGQIAAVIVGEDETEATLKRFYFSEGVVTLAAENSAFAPIVIVGSELEHVRVIGLAIAFTHVIK